MFDMLVFLIMILCPSTKKNYAPASMLLELCCTNTASDMRRKVARKHRLQSSRSKWKVQVGYNCLSFCFLLLIQEMQLRGLGERWLARLNLCAVILQLLSNMASGLFHLISFEVHRYCLCGCRKVF